ncbi:unnamed protein product [Tetraodon nigroviridis]|uniref:(spotted green pufferfish) hypothetical protein n=1 Tax=Tetraodon nigroviridis TaxID=99883 RepID=Q4SQZ9_TETNG|nr:unnamed protein product [Tetraodon nigroviridis]
MASSDGLDEDCVLQRGRSHSDPSSITEIRLGEAHRAGKRGACCQPTAGQVVGRERRHGGFCGDPALVVYAADVGCVVKRAS